MSFQHKFSIRHAAFGLAILLGLAQFAVASSKASPQAVLPKYQAECAACHVAYPPGMLPAASWARIMDGLGKHFGENASLDAATTKELATWLQRNAGTYKRVSAQAPQDRITRSAWFISRHDEISAATWKRASVKSASNCAACHTTASKGDFNERNVRIPR